jgi:hypothetical protein
MEQVSNSSSLAVSDFAARRFILLVDVLRDRGRVTAYSSPMPFSSRGGLETTHSEQLAWINLLGSRNVALSLLGYEIYDPDELVLLGLCQEPPAAIRATACFGPHVPRL